MKQQLLLLAAVLFCSFKVNAQNTSSIAGQVNDASGKSLNAITVMLHRSTDSAMVKTAVTNTQGKYEIAQVKAGSYFITTSAVGMRNASSPKFDVAEGQTATVAALSLQTANKNLQEVTVVS